MGKFSKPGSEFLKERIVQEHIEFAAQMVGHEVSNDFRTEMVQRLDFDVEAMAAGRHYEFDSPLEVLFWVWWEAVSKFDMFADSLQLLPHERVDLGEQYYVIDFIVRPGWHHYHRHSEYVKTNWPLVGIELDGHAFHEKTLEQVTYRNQRDRALQQAGWHVFHFSFSEFTSEPYAKVIEVVDFARDKEARLRSDEYELKEAKKALGSPAIPPAGEAAGQ
jgi:hypothetical protein